MNEDIKAKLRLLKLSLLSILHTLSVSDSIALELNEISQSINTAESELRGAISALRKIKFNNDSLIMPAGRDEDGRIRWRINEDIINKNELAQFLEKEIIGKEGLKIKKANE